MSDTQPGERTEPVEIGWSGIGVSLPVVLLGRGGLLAFLILWLGEPYIPLDHLQNTLIHALVPLAVIFGFGLKRFEAIGHLIRPKPTLISDSGRSSLLQASLSYGGSITALAAILVHSLIPEFELPDTLPTEVVTALDPYRLITLAVAALVLLPVVLMFRYPVFTADQEKLIAAVNRPSMRDHWKQRRNARYWDALLVLVLLLIGIIFLLTVSGRRLPGEASLLAAALVGLLYDTACTLFGGRTVGKWRRGVRIVSVVGDPISRWRAASRAVVLYTPLLAYGVLRLDAVWGSKAMDLWILVLVLYGLGMAHPYGRGFHDLVAGTRVTTPSDPPTDPQPVAAAVDSVPVLGLRLPRQELVATPEDPFGQDKLNRRPHVEALCRQITALDGYPVVMIDAGWGAGKTAFMTMCHAYLKSQGRKVVAYNAWRAGYTQQPLFDLVAAVDTALRSPETEAMAKSAAKVSSLRSIWAELRSPDTAAPVDLSELPAETQRAVAEFQTRLKNVVASNQGPLVVLIDELDRCRPTYAVETLEAVRHLFTVDGVVVVVAVNRKQLAEAVKGLYGAGFNADRYLHRFADWPVTLPTPDRDTRVPFLAGLTAETGLAEHVSSGALSQSALDLVADLPDAELRDIEHATHLATAVLSFNPPPTVQRNLWEWSVLALVVLRIANQNAYPQFVSGDIDGFAAVGKLNDALPKYSLDSPRAATRQFLEAALIHIGSTEDWRDPDQTNTFMGRYQGQAVRSTRRSQAALETLHSVLLPYPEPQRRVQVSQIAERMDFAAYDPVASSDARSAPE